jgi:hypothetical protein
VVGFDVPSVIADLESLVSRARERGIKPSMDHSTHDILNAVHLGSKWKASARSYEAGDFVFTGETHVFYLSPRLGELHILARSLILGISSP